MLNKIIEFKKQEIKNNKSKKQYQPLEKLKTAGCFYETLKKHCPAIIAEIKKGSPSKGIIRQDFNVAEIATAFDGGGASALSVLTDEHFFFGDTQNIAIAKKVSTLPILRKDFIIDEYQLFESQHLKADALLLIVAALDKTQLNDFYQIASELGLDVLVECHDEYEIETALKIEPQLLGINNRCLKTFKTSLQTTINLKSMIPSHINIVTESGIKDKKDIQTMLEHNINTFLIGEAFMRSENIKQCLKDFIT